MSAEDDKAAAEARARVLIEQQHVQAGWRGQKRKDILFAGQCIDVEDVYMKTDHARVDYLLYVDNRVVGGIEAEPIGAPLAGVQWQSAVYANGLPREVRLAAETTDARLTFVFEASGREDYFTNGSTLSRGPARSSISQSPMSTPAWRSGT